MIKIVTVNPFKVYLKNGPNSDLINVLSPLLMRSCFIGPLPASFSLFSFVQRLTVNKCYTYVKNSYDWIRTANHSANHCPNEIQVGKLRLCLRTADILMKIECPTLK